MAPPPKEGVTLWPAPPSEGAGGRLNSYKVFFERPSDFVAEVRPLAETWVRLLADTCSPGWPGYFHRYGYIKKGHPFCR